MRTGTLLIVFGLLATAFRLPGASAAGTGDSDKVLTRTEKTAHFTLHYRPGSQAGAGVDRIAVMAERDLTRICGQLAVPVDGSFHLWLYDDVAELAAVTRTKGNAGFSSVDASHIPFDNDQTRYHEMVHIVAYRLPKSGDEPRSLFFSEGLANALLEFVHGVPVHAVAAFERKRGSLPPLSEMTGAADFYAWLGAHPGFDAYDVAASYIRHLLDAHGVEKVKRYCTGQPAAKAFGVGEAEIEKAWHRTLDGFVIRPELETLLRRRRGEAVKFSVFNLDPEKRLPSELLGRSEDWAPLDTAALKSETAAEWSRKGGVVAGARTEGDDWTVCELGTVKYGDCAIRAKIRPGRPCVGVQLRLGAQCQAMITEAGAFIWKDGVAAAEPAEPLGDRKELDLILERHGNRVTVWLDGFKVLEGAASETEEPAGIGVAGGSAEFEGVRVRTWK